MSDRAPLYHLALRADWEAARSAGDYRVSTLGATLAEVGFIHLSFAHQVAAIAARFYADRDDVVLLTVDPDRLTSELRVEDVAGAGGFPHLYGPLPLDAVVDVAPWSADSVDDLELDG